MMKKKDEEDDFALFQIGLSNLKDIPEENVEARKLLEKSLASVFLNLPDLDEKELMKNNGE